MKFLSRLKNIFASTCMFFTAITLVMSGISSVLSDAKLTMIFPVIIKIFIFSLIFSILNCLLYAQKLNVAVRILLHYIGLAISFFVIFIVAGNYSSGAAGKFVVMLAYTLIYAIIAAILLIIRYKKKKAKKENETYTSQFDFAKNDN